MRYWCIETLKLADVYTVEEDIHKWTKLAGFVTEVEAKAWKVMLERGNDFAYS